MSHIYIQEPTTNGKVLLKTTVGDIDIELWSRECPKACRNFIQLCLEGYYDNNIFHRLVKGFIVQTGDPTGTGMGGESIYGKPFKDELHSRLRFVRRGLVAMANSGVNDDNTSQFFFTLDACPDLQNKHTIFGKISGNTIYNMIRLEESEVDQNERPLYPHKIISTEILLNPFPDIIPRVVEKKSEEKVEKKSKSKATKNFNLLSFGDEAEEEEEEVMTASKAFAGKSKSSHDVLKDDPKLSALPAVDKSELKEWMTSDEEVEEKKDETEGETSEKKSQRLDRIKNKLKKDKTEKSDDVLDKDEEEFFENEKQKKLREQQSCLEKVKDEFKALKKQMCAELKKKCEKVVKCKAYDNPAVAEFIEEAKKYKEASSNLPKKGCQMREQLCLGLLEKFKSKLLSTREKKEGEECVDESRESDWLSHQMHCQKEEEVILAKDANIRNEEDWYDIYDPRNPINKRRREEGLEGSTKKGRVK